MSQEKPASLQDLIDILKELAQIEERATQLDLFSSQNFCNTLESNRHEFVLEGYERVDFARERNSG